MARRRALGKGVLVGLFVIGFGVALFFSVYVWPPVSKVIGKIMDQLGEAQLYPAASRRHGRFDGRSRDVWDI